MPNVEARSRRASRLIVDQSWLDANWLRLHDAVSRHFVVISYASHWPDPVGSPDVTFDTVGLSLQFCSGFVIAVDDVWFVVTAGHVIDAVLDHEEKGRVIRRFELMHGFHNFPDAQRFTPIALRGPPFRIFKNGLDYAALPISETLQRALESNGVIPITRGGVASPSDRFDVYALLGIPEQGCSIDHADSGHTRNLSIGMTIPFLPIQPAIPSRELAQKVSGFYGRILSLYGHIDERPVSLDDIGGMSGGPLFGIRDGTGRIDYRLVS